MKDEAMLALAKEFAKNLKTEADLNNFSKALKKLTVETILNAELTDHLGYEKHSPRVGKNARNGLAVVSVERDACGGCFNKIPPQRQMDIRMRKKIIVCEYCGRILVDKELAGAE